MKISAVYARVALTEKPDWLDDFRVKFENHYEYHVTLKQPVFIDEYQLPVMKAQLEKLLIDHPVPEHRIQLVFSTIEPDRVEPGEIDSCIMLMSEPNQAITGLQKSIVTLLQDFSQNVEPQTRAYEKNFRSHLTITGNLGNRFDEARAELHGKNVRCVGEITEIVLSCTDNDVPEEVNNPANLTVFKL